MKKTLLATICVWLVMAGAWAGDFASERQHNWHQWRGPQASGVAPHGDPPVEWDEATHVKWKVEIPGRGTSTPIVWDDQIFILTAIETDRKKEGAVQPKAPEPKPEAPQRQGRRRFGQATPPINYYQFVVLSIDRASGEVLWKQIANEQVPHEGFSRPYSTYASASPTTDGRYLYASFGSFGIYCYDVQGVVQWKRDLGDMRTPLNFGEGSSPVLHGDTLVVNWDHLGQSFIVALDAKTGKTRWKVDRDERATWATPLIVERDGRTQVITNASNRMRSYDLATGDLIWECGGQASNPIPSPVTRDDLVYCMTGFRGYALYAIPLDSSGDLTDTDKIAWHREEGTPYVSSPILYGDLLFFTKSRNAILSCLNPATGEPLIREKRLSDLGGLLFASPVGAADRIYFLDRDGAAVVIRRSGELEILATNQLDDVFDASPAIVGKQMFLRGAKHLYCIEE